MQWVFQLADGSRVVGTPSIDSFKMATQYAGMKVPFARLRTFEFNAEDGTARISFQNGDQLKGRVPTMDVPVKTATGQVLVALTKVRKIYVGDGLMPEGMVLHYTFDTKEGDRAVDSSGEGNHGKIQGATFTKEGKVFGALRFSGDGDAVIVGNPASLRLNKAFTIMAWIKREDADKVSKTTEYGEIFGYGHGGYVMGIEETGDVYLSQADIHMSATSSFQIHDKEFHHVVMTKDGDKVVFYLDGVAFPAEGLSVEGDFEFTTDAAVGARSDDLHKCFLGIIDDVAVFKRALSADEVKKVYESQK